MLPRPLSLPALPPARGLDRTMPPSSETLDWLGDPALLRAAVRGVVAAVLRGSDAEVDDVTNEVFRRALEGRARVRSGEPVRPWVLGIARHAALDARRARARSARRVDADASGRLEALEAAGVPEDRAASRLALERALDGLAPREREVLLLFHVEGLDYRAIAERLGAPMGSVATWLARGRKTLGAKLRGGDA